MGVTLAVPSNVVSLSVFGVCFKDIFVLNVFLMGFEKKKVIKACCKMIPTGDMFLELDPPTEMGQERWGQWRLALGGPAETTEVTIKHT